MKANHVPSQVYMPERASIPPDLTVRFASRVLPHPSRREEYERSDAVQVTRVLGLVATQYPYAFGLKHGFGANHSAESMQRIIEKAHNTIVCEHQGEIVGGATYARPYPGTLELVCLFRDRAAPRGIGKVLLREVLLMTRAKGDSEVVLDVMSDPNAEDGKSGARLLYESVGFEPDNSLRRRPDAATRMRLVGDDNITGGVELLTKQINQEYGQA